MCNINTWDDGDDLYRGGREKQVSGKKIQHSDAGMLSLKTREEFKKTFHHTEYLGTFHMSGKTHNYMCNTALWLFV